MRKSFVSFLTVILMIVSVLPQRAIGAEIYHDAYSAVTGGEYAAYNTDIYKNGINFSSNNTDGFMYYEGAWVSYLIDFGETGADTLVMNMRPNVKNTQGTFAVYADDMNTAPIAVFDQSKNIPYAGYTSYAAPGYKDYFFTMSRHLTGKHTVYFKALSNACTYFSSFEFISSDKNITDFGEKIKPSDNPNRLWGTSRGVKQENDGDGNTYVLSDIRGCVYVPAVDFGNNPSEGADSVTVRYARWYKETENTGGYEVRLDSIDGEVIGTIAEEDVSYGEYKTYTFYFTKTLTDIHTLVFAVPDKTTISYIQFNKTGNVEFSWIGNSYSGKENENGMKEFMLHDVAAMYVSPQTGKLYTNAYWSEGGSNFSEITDGKLTNIGYGSHGWGYEGGYAVTANSKYVYFSQSASYKGKNDGNWPQDGYAWFGVTRRLVSDITMGDAFDGMKSANGGSSSRYFLPIDELAVYGVSDGEEQPEGTVSGSDECVISGLAATDTELFVSDAFYEKIKVYDADKMTFKREWDCPNPGQMTIDSFGNLWVTEPEDNQIICFSTDGDALRVISFPETVKIWSLAATADGRLLVPDRGVNENIMVYGGLNKTRPTLEEYIGVQGGIFSGNAGEVGEERFYQISGIGADSENNIYVCNSGAFDPSDSNSFGTAFIESYTKNHTLRWRLYGLEFLDSAVADPNNPSDIYTKFERFSMDYSKETGKEQTYAAYTLNPHKYPNDFRITNNSVHPIAVRTVNGVKMLFATDMYGYSLFVYRFNPKTDGEIAIPCMAIYDDTKARQVTFMQDTTGDGSFDTNEVMYSGNSGSRKYIHVWLGWDVDDNGNIYNARNGDCTIAEYAFGGINGNGVPIWEQEKIYEPPKLFKGENTDGFNPKKYSDLRMSRYDAANDAMYLTGAFNDYNYNDGNGSVPMKPQSKSPGDTLARVDNWSKGNREPSYIIAFDYSKKLYQNKYLNLNSGFAVCGDYIFVCESAFTELGAIHIYAAETGEWVQDIPYNSYFGEIGLMDIVMPMSAAKISESRYMILLEDDLCSKILTVYWRPPAELLFSKADFLWSDTSCTVQLTCEKINFGNTDINIYFAVYENNRLSELRMIRKESAEITRGTPFTVSETFSGLLTGQEIRVMTWDDNYRPLKTVDSYFVSGNVQ